jgi:hypothetical protein
MAADVDRHQDDTAADVLAAEAWFRRRGLPWFIDSVDARVRALLRRRLLWVLLVGVATSAIADIFVENSPSAVLLGVAAGLAVLLAYVGGPLRVAVIARWAARRAVAELDLMLPLVTRALPLLLVFMTFLFINTEVWQVASALSVPRLSVVALVFSAVGTAFLLARLPQEVRDVQETVAGDGIAQACRETPLEQRAHALAEARVGATGEGGAGEDGAGEPLTGTQRANLLLMLLVMQTLQVLLLVLAVFAFFVVFGLVAIHPTVVESWIGHAPNPVVWHFGSGAVRLPVSWELVRVSVVLSTFSGLYFTVYAVTDANYRNQFFGELSRGLEQAVGVREVYRVLLRESRRHAR